MKWGKIAMVLLAGAVQAGSSEVCAAASNGAEDIIIKVLTGAQCQEAKQLVGSWRLEEFRKYPYLYAGTVEGESKFFDWISARPHYTVAVAYRGNEPVGFITGLALADFADHTTGLTEAMEKAGFKIGDYYYFCEAIVKGEHRHQHIGLRLLQALEAHAKTLGFSGTSGAYEHHESHPLKPADYRDEAAAAKRLGYVQSTVTSTHEWSTVLPDGSTGRLPHTLSYWFKKF